jgi:hypothetical protein
VITVVRRTGSALAALVAALTLAAFVLAAAPADAAGYAQIQNKEHGLFVGPACLDIVNASGATGAKAGVEWCDHYGMHEEWIALPVGDGSGFVQLKVHHSGLCLEVYGGQYSDGAQVVQFPCLPNRPQQQWAFVYKSWDYNNFYEVVARHSGKCLDKSGWNVIQWNCHGGDWQQWTRPY